MVVWERGQMKKSDYRRFKIQTVTGANDFASMQEVVLRRYRDTEDLARPDLVLIDGGLGQLAAAMEGLKQAGQPSLAVIGLAKARGEKEERIFLPGRKNPILLRANSPATHLVQRIRDEAHRFALTFHRKLRSKALLASQLDQIIGVGEIRRASLLRRFKTLEGLAAASDEDLRGTGLSTQTIHDLRTQLGTKTSPRS
jgi:excinuclease ABC subunit C